MIVTGSARLDQFRRGGDSLFGRYHYLRLHPLSISEVSEDPKGESTELLLKYGGFPEPFLRQDETFARIWRRERISRVIQQDLRDLTNLKDYVQLEQLANLLPSKVGSLLSVQCIAEHLEKSPHTIQNWIEILSSVYQCFLIPPFGPPKVKSIKKAKKLYLWDWSAVEEEEPRFENLVAGHPLRFCHHMEDTQGHAMELRFLKDQFGHELDFVVLKDKKPILGVACKTGEKSLNREILYYRERVKIERLYQVPMGSSDIMRDGVRLLPFLKFCQIEKLVSFEASPHFMTNLTSYNFHVMLSE